GCGARPGPRAPAPRCPRTKS
ncbi:hypothetical protein NJB1728f10_03820, partial [Mycobacterium marinum]